MAVSYIQKPAPNETNGTRTYIGVPSFGFITTGTTTLFLYLILPLNISGKTISNASITEGSQIRLANGGYLDNIKDNGVVSHVDNYGSTLLLTIIKKNSGTWNATNNSLVAGYSGVSFNVS